MSNIIMKIGTFALVLLLMAGSISEMQSSYAAATPAKAKVKPIVMSIIVDSKEDAEIDVKIERISKDKTTLQIKTVVVKAGINYINCNNLTKGNYRVTISSYGDDLSQEITAIQGRYSLFFMTAPPKDEDTQGKSKINYVDFDKYKKPAAPAATKSAP